MMENKLKSLEEIFGKEITVVLKDCSVRKITGGDRLNDFFIYLARTRKKQVAILDLENQGEKKKIFLLYDLPERNLPYT